MFSTLNSYCRFPLGKEVMFNAEQNGKKYLLTLSRTNFTEINFNLKIDGNTT